MMQRYSRILHTVKWGYFSRPASTAVPEALQQDHEEYANARPFMEIPGPKSLPIIGILYLFLPGFRHKYDFSNLHTTHQQLQAEFGDIVRFSGLGNRRDIVFIYKPEDAERLYRNEGIWPERPGFRSLTYYRNHTRKDFFKGDIGVLINQGEAWQQARSQVNPILMQTRTVQLYASRIDQVAEDFAVRIPQLITKDNKMPDDFTNELHKWALESIAMVALDTRLGCLSANLAPDSEPQRMIEAVHTLFQCLHKLEVEDVTWTLISTPTWRKFVKVLDFFCEVSMKYIQQVIERSKHKSIDDGDASVLERFLKRDPNPSRAVIMALDMLFAGIDTTSYALANVLLHLATNQEKQDKIYREVCSFMPDPSVPLSMEILNEMRYLRACIKESMRLNPIVAGNARTTQNEIILSNYRIPAGVDVVITNAVMSLMEKNFPKANQFIPERWLRNKNDNPFIDFKINPFVSLPFSHGARKCVGMRFASLELEIILAKFVRRYKWEWHQPKMTYKSALITKPVDPLRFTVHERS